MRSAATPHQQHGRGAASAVPSAKRARIESVLESAPNEMRGVQTVASDATSKKPDDATTRMSAADLASAAANGATGDDLDELLALVDSAPESTPLTVAEARSLLTRLSRSIERNMDARFKHASDPTKFLDSELALDEAIQAVRQGFGERTDLMTIMDEKQADGETAIQKICNLIVNHENIDIAIDCIRLLSDLIDAEVLLESAELEPLIDTLTGASSYEQMQKADEKASNGSQSSSSSARPSTSAAVDPPLFICTLVTSLSRFPDEHLSEQSEVVGLILGILENLTDMQPQRVCTLIIRFTKFLQWAMDRIKAPGFDQNKLYASELLSIVLSNSGRAGQDSFGSDVSAGVGVRQLIRAMAIYRKNDPANSEETEHMENLFDALCLILHQHESNQKKFAEHDGMQLMITMIRRNTYARTAAFKALDYAVTNSPSNCALLIDIGGLKTVFAAYMSAATSKRDKSLATSTEQHLLNIITQLFLHSADIRYLRLLNKFKEQEMLKTERTVELLVKYQTRLDEAEAKHKADRESAASSSSMGHESDDAIESYLRQSDHGLQHVELAATILAFLATAGDKELRARVEQLLNQQDLSPLDLQRILLRHVAMMADGDDVPAEIVKTKSILKALADMLTDEDDKRVKETKQ